MKKTIFIFSLLIGLGAAQTATAQNRNGQTVEGNGKLVSRDISVQSFTSLKASGIYELTLLQGAKEGVKIDADENLQDLFTIKNEGAKLVIEMKKENDSNVNIRSKNKTRVYVTFQKLKEIELSTIGNVLAKESLSFDDLQVHNKSVGNMDLNLTANKLDLENKSVGNVTLSGKAQAAVLRNNGVGSIRAGSFVVQTMDIDNSGVGSAEVNAEKELKVKDNFLGKVKNRGAGTLRRMGKVVI